MGKVSDYLIAQIVKQVDERAIVVWYDPEAEYRSLIERLSLPDLTVCRYDGSFFALRHQIEPFIAQDPEYDPETKRITAPRLLVYLPMAREATEAAMIEAEKTGVVMEPGGSGTRNTRLDVVVRAALKGVPAETLEQITRGISSGAFGLAEVEALAEQGAPGAARLAAVFGPIAPQAVALRFLTELDLDATLESKGGVSELLAMLQVAFGCEVPISAGPQEIRKRLTRHIFLGALAAEIPPGMEWEELKSLPLPSGEKHRESCRLLAEAWRDSEKLRPLYCEAAEQVQGEYRITGGDVLPEALEDAVTFPFSEAVLLQAAGRALVAGDREKAHTLAAKRLGGFWSRIQPECGLRWRAMDLAAQLLSETDRVEAGLQRLPADPGALIRRYTDGSPHGEGPWCSLDRLHRSLGRLYADLDADPALDPAIRLIRKRYASVLDRMTTAFADTLAASGWSVTGVPRQAGVFQGQVEPLLQQGRVAYVWVDALRFEMGRELAETLGGSYEVACVPVLAVAPTITLAGMAALCPGADQGLTLAERKGSLVVQLGEHTLRDRKDRVELVRSKVSGRMVDLYLRELQKPTRSVQESVRGATLVLVTSQEIDKYAGHGDDDHARAVMEGVLLQLKRAIRNLFQLGVETVILTADHGFLFGEPLMGEMMVDPPGGQTLLLERRVWVGRGGDIHQSVIRVRAGDLGLGGDLEIGFPKSYAAFRGQGSRAYLHGGISLQEVVVPVITVRRGVAAPATRPTMNFRLSMDRLRITSRVFSVAIEFEADLMRSRPVVQCVTRAQGREVAHVVAAEYGLREGTRELELGYTSEGHPRRNVVTFMFEGEPSFAQVSVHLLDAETQAELSRLESVPLAIAL